MKFSSASKVMVKPVPYFISAVSVFRKFGEVLSYYYYRSSHNVCCWARFQPSTAHA